MKALGASGITMFACALSSGVANAQASKSEMAAFPMPPAAVHANKTFAYVGDYGYYTSPSF